jgi:uncharacterized protein YkwD
VRLFLLVALLALRTGCKTPSAPDPHRSAPPVAAQPDASDPIRQLELKVFTAANRQRQLHGLSQLAWSEPLAEQARLHSVNMMERGFFSHVDPVRGAPSKRLNSAGIPWSRNSENIFRERGMDDPANVAMEGWMQSPVHRQSLLDPLFTQTGVGVAISPDTEYFITQVFIRPPAAARN